MLKYLDRYGREAVSRQAMKGFFSYYLGPKGAIAYQDTGGYWLAVGSPWAEEGDVAEVANNFHRSAQRHGRQAAFFAVEPHTLRLLDHPRVQLGLQPVFDPKVWAQDHANSGEVGRQRRRAERKGVTVRRVSLQELFSEPLYSQVERLCQLWVENRPMAEMGYLVTLDFLKKPGDRTFFLAETQGSVGGLLACIPARDGWFLENLVVDRSAPNGTCELLVAEAITWMSQEGARFATLGMLPLAHLDPDNAAWNHRHAHFLDSLFRFSYSHLNWLYNFRGLYSFKAKFQPQDWEPVYLVAPNGVGLGTLYHVLKAFSGGSLIVFGLATVARWWRALSERFPRQVWAGVAYFFSLALFPWILILLNCDSSKWFGVEWLAIAWAGFDLAVAIAFFILAACISRGLTWGRYLADFLVGVVGADVWITWSQVFLFNRHRLEGPLDVLVTLAGMAAPFLAFLFLLTMANSNLFRSLVTRQSREL